MAQGSKDWTNAITLYALAPDGTLTPVKINAAGQLIAVMTGTDGVDPQTILTDDEGRMITVIRDPVNDRYMAINALGQIVAVMTGTDGVEPQTILTDDEGRMITVIRDPVNDRYLAIDADGNIVAVMKGDYGGTLKTISLDEDGRMIALIKGTRDITRALRLWYRFNPNDEVIIHDSSAWGNVGDSFVNLLSGADYTDGILGPGLLWSGAINYVDVGDDGMFNFTNRDFSLESWLYTDSLAFVLYIMGRGLVDTDGWELYSLIGGKIRFVSNQAAASQTVTSISSLPNKTWTHVIVTRSGDTVKIYINGLDDTDGVPVIINPLTSARHLRIGADDTLTKSWYGRQDEVRIYTACLTPTEVLIRYNLTKPGRVETLQTINVNALGETAVNIKSLPYNKTVSGTAPQLIPAAGNQITDSTHVPAGKFWCITVIHGYLEGTLCDEFTFSVRRALGGNKIFTVKNAAAMELADFLGTVHLTAGEWLRLEVINTVGAGEVFLTWNGYEITIPM